MSLGIHSLKNTLENIKKYLEKTFTKEMAQQLCLDAHQFATLSKSIEESGLAAALSTFFQNANKEELAAKLGKSAEDISALIEKFNNTEVIEHFNSLLLRVHSYADLLQIEPFLKQYGHLVPYAAVGCTVLGTLMPIMLTYAASQNSVDKKFQQFCQQRLDLIAATSMQTMKLNAGSFLLAFESKSQKGVVAEQDKERLEGLANQARKIIDYTPDLDMAELNHFAEQLFNNLYISVGADPLSEVTKHLSSEMIDVACRNELDAMPSLYHGEVNYALVKKLYGSDAVHAVMTEIQKNLQRNGGDAIYYDVRYAAERRGMAFSQKMQEIGQAYRQNSEHLDDALQNSFLSQLKQAANSIKSRLNKQDLPEDVVNVIVNRALLGYCKHTGSYFAFPWNLKEEMMAGFVDTAEAVSSIDGLCDMFNKTLTFSERPVRVTTQVVSTAAVAIGAVAVGVATAKRRMPH